MRICKVCQESKPLEKFPVCSPKNSPKEYRNHTCHSCTYQENKKKYPHLVNKNREYHQKWENKNPEVKKMWGYKSWDKKQGFSHDLDLPFVKEMISQPCFYCGSSHGIDKMTLDRIDNTKGHTKSNVNPACYRCNILRGDMPYAAWIFLAPAIREAHKQNLFGDWRLSSKKSKKLKTNPNEKIIRLRAWCLIATCVPNATGMPIAIRQTWMICLV